MRGLFNKSRSLLRLCWVLLRDLSGALRALLKGDTPSAGGHLRNFALSLHEDLLNTLMALQRKLPFWKALGPDIDRILIVKIDRIGDMVVTTPVFDILHELFPKARLDLVGHPGPLSLLEGDERISERIPYRSWVYHPLPILPPGPRTWWLLLRLMLRRYPLVVYLRGSVPLLCLGLTSRFAATKYVFAEPVIDRYMGALERLLGPVPRKNPRLLVTAEDTRAAQELLRANNGQAGPHVAIHAAASVATRTWPPERFAAVADELRREHRAHVHFLSGPADRPILDRIARAAAFPHSYHSTLRLPQVAALIRECDLFIGNDSALMHMAAAVGTRLVVLWGSANLSMSYPRTTPEKCIVIYQEVACRDGCLEFRCHNPEAYACLMRTEAADVLEAARKLLHPAGNGTGSHPLPLAAPPLQPGNGWRSGLPQ
jgi:ADP-heptose:LPS heptosyltransferase